MFVTQFLLDDINQARSIIIYKMFNTVKWGEKKRWGEWKQNFEILSASNADEKQKYFYAEMFDIMYRTLPHRSALIAHQRCSLMKFQSFVSIYPSVSFHPILRYF